MKSIEFIAPVESMRGNLSGRQKLEYPTDNNAAFEGPVGSVNYARNYGPRFIGAKVAKTGKKYFSVRLKSANHLTLKSKNAMALLGGAGAIYAAILRTPAVLAGIQAQYAALQELGEKRSFRKYVMDTVRQGLIQKQLNFTFAGPATSVVVNNPWVKVTGDLNISISNEIRVKFWTELAVNGITFKVGSLTAIARTGDNFHTLIGSTNYNVIGLSEVNNIDPEYEAVMLGDSFLKTDATTYVEPGDLVASIDYLLTDVAPA